MRRPFDWEDAGARLGSELDHHHAIVVLGDDVVATAEVALGIGRAQSTRRRVAVCDLLGEAPPIQALVESDDLHGIVDSFTYGVSLNRIARESHTDKILRRFWQESAARQWLATDGHRITVKAQNGRVVMPVVHARGNTRPTATIRICSSFTCKAGLS